ncbi:MAG: PEP/pyruvate-binding domain-containing protein [Chloroflexota bacterium]
MTYTLPFEQCNQDSVAQVGGKCASLGAMIQAEAPVPPGFAITTDAYQAMLDTDGLAETIQKHVAQLDPSDVAEEETISQTIRALIEKTPIPAEVERAIRAAYTELCEQNGVENLPVAVRSSATAEDLPGASFAGQQDTFLWIVGADNVLEHVKKCWSSLYTARAIAYRQDNDFLHEKVLMSVAVQKMVNAKAAGVAFTLNPINGDRSKITIDSSWGLGEAVVSGEVTPDNYLVDKVIFEIVKKTISSKHIEYAVDLENQCTIKRDVEPERQTEPSLTQEELIAVAKMAKRAEKFYKAPQDVEWAIDADLPAPNNVVILQSRPETVWSQKKQESVSTSQPFGMAGMINTLIKGVETGVKKPQSKTEE